MSQTYIVVRLDVDEDRIYAAGRLIVNGIPWRQEVQVHCQMLADVYKQKVQLHTHTDSVLATFQPSLPASSG